MSANLHLLVRVRSIPRGAEPTVAAAVGAILDANDLGRDLTGPAPAGRGGELAWASDPAHPVIIASAHAWVPKLQRSLERAVSAASGRAAKLELTTFYDEDRGGWRDALRAMTAVRRKIPRAGSRSRAAAKVGGAKAGAARVGAAKPQPAAAGAASKGAPAGAARATRMRRFHLVAGASKKFWSVAVVGSTLIVRFGRLRTTGQRKDKAFASPAAAQAAMDALIAEKRAKGYREVRPA